MIHVRMLGRAEVLAGERRITPDSAMLFALALFLSVSAGQRVQRSRLLEMFWPDASDDHRRHALRQLLYRLRRGGFPLCLDGEELLVAEEMVESDIRCVLAPGWPEEARREDVEAAADVLPGYDPPMPEAYREWLDELRSRVNSQCRRALLRQIDAARRDGRWHDVDDCARRCLTVDPLNEEATLAHAEAIAMSGSKTKALQVIDEYLHELGDRDRVIGLPAKVLRRRVSERAPERGRGEQEIVPLIGREREVAQLVDSLTGTLSGQGAALFIEGAAGIGKSRLAKELLAIAAMRGWRTLSTQLQASDIQRPLGVFVDLFGALLQMPGALGCSPASLAQLRLLTEHEVRTEAEAQRSQEAEAVQERLRAAAQDLLESVVSEGPLVLWIDDLHWCDESSIRLLQHLLSCSAALPVMWVMTARQAGRYASLREAMSDLRVETMQVAPLTPESTNALFGVLADRAGDPGPAVPSELTSAVTGGNPLFVLELMRHVRETGQALSLPQSLRALIRDRAARLSPLAQHVLHTCAVLGRYSSVPRVASVLEIGTADLLACIEELDALGIVGTSRDAEVLSIHDLWRDELLKKLLPASRKLLHHRCGIVLEGECRVPRSPSMVWEAAQHLLASGSQGRALSLLEECAQHQMDNGLPADAATTFEMAERASTNDVDRFRSMTGRIAALRRAANWIELARVVEPAIELSARSAMVWSRHSDLELLRLEVQWWTETAPENSLEHALTCVNDETATASHRISAALLSMIVSANLARLKELAPILQVIEALPQDGLEDRINVLSATMIYHTEAGDLDVALAAATALISAERERGSVRGLARALRFASYPLRCLGDYATAMTLLRESLELAERHLLVVDAASASDSIVNMCLEQDDIPAAQRWVARAKSWSSLVRARYARTSPSINDALIALAMGNYAAVESLVDADLDSHSRDPVIRQKLLHLSALVRLFSHRAETTRLARACDLLGEALRVASTIGRLDYVVASYAAGLVTLGNSTAAVEFVRRYLSDQRRDRSTPSRQLARFVEDASMR